MEVAAACVAGTAGLAAVYRVARPYFSVRVNCHFCNNNYKVRHEEANSWVCPGCGQYNGWTQDGDYNRDLGLDTEDGGHSHNTAHNISSSSNNGLCRGCNLNQELKVAALARCEYEGEELAEHRAHLEAAYRLCPQCEATLQSRLAEQDRSLAPAVLQWRLETSREASRRLPAPGPASAPHLHLLLALVTLVTQWPGLALWLQHTKLPAWLELQLEAALFPHLSPAEAAAQLLPSLGPALLLVAVVTSLASRHLALASCHLMNLLLILSSQPPAAQLVCSCLAVLTAAVATSGPRRKEKKERKSPGPVLTSTPVPPPDTASVLTQDLLSSASSLSNPPPAPPPPLSTAAPPRACMVTSPELSPLGPGAVSGLLRSSSEQSFNHEFASVTGSPRPGDRDCDLASLSLGSQLTSTPRQSPFPIGRCYSPVPAPDTCSLFSPRTRSRPLLAPSRLTSTSWVAGGYWGGPGSTLGPATVSRASSISSGFVSGRGSLASTALGSHYPSSQLGPGFRRRTVDESISDSDTPHPSQAPPSPPPSPAPAVSAAPPPAPAKAPGWTITVRVTPTDLLLAASVCVNVGLAILWLSSS